MSYARWSYSDLYVYDCNGIGLLCESCELLHGPAGYWVVEDSSNGFMDFKRGERRPFSSAFVAGSNAAAMVEHLEHHVREGHDVGAAIEQLRDEMERGEWK